MFFFFIFLKVLRKSREAAEADLAVHLIGWSVNAVKGLSAIVLEETLTGETPHGKWKKKLA